LVPSASKRTIEVEEERAHCSSKIKRLENREAFHFDDSSSGFESDSCTTRKIPKKKIESDKNEDCGDTILLTPECSFHSCTSLSPSLFRTSTRNNLATINENESKEFKKDKIINDQLKDEANKSLNEFLKEKTILKKSKTFCTFANMTEIKKLDKALSNYMLLNLSFDENA
jgi:hypothetical protein